MVQSKFDFRTIGNYLPNLRQASVLRRGELARQIRAQSFNFVRGNGKNS